MGASENSWQDFREKALRVDWNINMKLAGMVTMMQEVWILLWENGSRSSFWYQSSWCYLLLYNVCGAADGNLSLTLKRESEMTAVEIQVSNSPCSSWRIPEMVYSDEEQEIPQMEHVKSMVKDGEGWGPRLEAQERWIEDKDENMEV